MDLQRAACELQGRTQESIRDESKCNGIGAGLSKYGDDGESDWLIYYMS